MKVALIFLLLVSVFADGATDDSAQTFIETIIRRFFRHHAPLPIRNTVYRCQRLGYNILDEIDSDITKEDLCDIDQPGEEIIGMTIDGLLGLFEDCKVPDYVEVQVETRQECLYGTDPEVDWLDCDSYKTKMGEIWSLIDDRVENFCNGSG